MGRGDSGLPGGLARDGRGDDAAREPAGDPASGCGGGLAGRIRGPVAPSSLLSRRLGGLRAAAFLGDIALHAWSTRRHGWPPPWLIEAGVAAPAGGYQLAPLKRRSLVAAAIQPRRCAARPQGAGRRWGLGPVPPRARCVGSSWALMLLMFADGFASLLVDGGAGRS